MAVHLVESSDLLMVDQTVDLSDGKMVEHLAEHLAASLAAQLVHLEVALMAE